MSSRSLGKRHHTSLSSCASIYNRACVDVVFLLLSGYCIPVGFFYLKKSTLSFLYCSIFYLSRDSWAGKAAPRALEQAARGRATFATCVEKLRLSSYLRLAQGEKEMKAELPYEVY